MCGSLLQPSSPCNCFKPNLIWDNQQKDDPVSPCVYCILLMSMHSFFTRLYPMFFSSNMYKKSWPLLYIKTSFYIEPSVDTSFCYWADHTTQACFCKDELVVRLWTLVNASLEYSLAVYLCLCVSSPQVQQTKLITFPVLRWWRLLCDISGQPASFCLITTLPHTVLDTCVIMHTSQLLSDWMHH